MSEEEEDLRKRLPKGCLCTECPRIEECVNLLRKAKIRILDEEIELDLFKLAERDDFPAFLLTLAGAGLGFIVAQILKEKRKEKS